MRRRCHGLALFDVILALGIIGLLIGGGVLLLQRGQGQIQVNDTISLVNQICSGVQAAYAGQSDYTGLTAVTLNRRGKMPSISFAGADLTDENNYHHPFGAQVEIEGFTGRRYLVALHAMDGEPCQDIITPYVGKARAATGLVSVAVIDNGATTPSGVANREMTGMDDPSGSADTPDLGSEGVTAGDFEAAHPPQLCDHGESSNKIVMWFSG